MISEYSKIMIGQLKLQLENELMTAITDALKGTESLEVEIDLGRGDRITYIENDEEYSSMEITIESIEDDGEEYSMHYELSELSLNELYKLYEFLKKK